MHIKYKRSNYACMYVSNTTNNTCCNVLLTFACSILVDNSLEAKPPNTRECMAPSLADANMATRAWGIIGM